MIFFLVRKRMQFRDIYLSVLLLAVVVATLFSTTPTSAESLAMRLSGKILLQVESKGEAWYIYPDTHERFYLGRPDDAFRVMRELGLGISNADLALIPEAGTTSTGNRTLRDRLSGKILLQVEANGEAWYVNPDTTRRHYLGRPTDAFNLMRSLGLGISNLDLISIPISPDSTPSNGIAHIPAAQTPDLGDGKDAQRVSLLNSMNAHRLQLGLSGYSLNHELSSSAQMQVDDMRIKGYLDFTSPEGKGIKDFVASTGYEAHTLAENIIQTNSATSSIVSLWQNEAGVSYANVIHQDYHEIGVGMTTINGLPVYTVVFALPFEQFFIERTAGLADMETVRSTMLALVNAKRAEVGAPALTMNHLLNLSAQGHAYDMYNRSYYAHESPEGTNVFTRVSLTGFNPQLASENIAKNQLSVTEVMDSWMNSEGHRVNILDTRVTDVGFGLAYGKTMDGYAVLWVQNFALHE